MTGPSTSAWASAISTRPIRRRESGTERRVCRLRCAASRARLPRGFRFGVDGRATRADEYGRLFDRQTFGTNHDDVANLLPRADGQGVALGNFACAALVDSTVVELALEGRAALPIEQGSEVALQFGMPVWFHLGRSARLDTGLWR